MGLFIIIPCFARPIPKADKTPEKGLTKIFFIFIESATRQAC